MADVAVFFLLGMAVAFLIIWSRKRFASFAAQTAEDYEDAQPDFDMRRHLDGPMVCEGAIFGPTGRISSTFVADFDVTWSGDVCVIAESFVYDDNTTQQREWTITMLGPDHFEATASDVPGKATGEVAGPVVLFRYPIQLPADIGGHVLRAFDCMYLTPNGTIVNRSEFRKFGFKVAQLVATIRPRDAA